MGLKVNFPSDGIPPNTSISFDSIQDDSILYRNGGFLFQLVHDGAIIIHATTGEVTYITGFLPDWLADNDLGDYFTPTNLSLEINVKSTLNPLIGV